MSTNEERKTSDAMKILYNRYLKGNPELQRAVESEKRKLSLAGMIYDLREKRGLTQKELADALECTEEQVNRIEEADWEDEEAGDFVPLIVRISQYLYGT